MVITRSDNSNNTSTINNSTIKAVNYASQLNKHPFNNKRTSELPLLRYETSSAEFLNITSHYHCYNKSAVKKSIQKKLPQYDAKPPLRSQRRVRFNLSSPDGDGKSGGVDVKFSTGDDEWLRTPASFSQRLEFEKIKLQNITRRQSATRNIPSSSSSINIIPFASSSSRKKTRIHSNGNYNRSTLSPTANTTAHGEVSHGDDGHALLRAARDADETLLRDLLHRASRGQGLTKDILNAVDTSGRTILSYIASNGFIELLEEIVQLPDLDPNKSDNEGNSPLHFAAQAGQVECLNCMLSRCRGIEIDAKNNLGFTPLMKAALQGRNKCAKLLLFGGANPTLRDNGRGFRADQWARFCGRYVCADVIEKHARQRLLERSTYNSWGLENEVSSRLLMGKVVPVPVMPQSSSNVNVGFKSRLRKVFRSSSGSVQNRDSSARLVSQLTSAALCASTPVLPSGPTVPPVIKSLIRPLTVPRLQVTLVSNNGEFSTNKNLINGIIKPPPINDAEDKIIKPAGRSKKKK